MRDHDGADLRSLPLGERRERLQAVLPATSPIISEALSVTGRGCELFELMCSNDLEGIVAKRLAIATDTRMRWLKIKNPDYSRGRQGGSVQRATAAHRASGRVAVNSYTGPPMTLGNAAAARVRLIVWCKACGHQVEPDPAEQAQRYGVDTAVPEWRERLVYSACGSRDVDMVVSETERW
jgi:hypothetical protein